MHDQAMKILLVEEDSNLDVGMVRRLMKQCSLDHPIIRAASAEEAVATLKSATCESPLSSHYIILLDMSISRQNGLKLLEAVQGDEVLLQVPVYVLSKTPAEHNGAEAQIPDITDYSVEPVTNQLIENMHKVGNAELTGNLPPCQSPVLAIEAPVTNHPQEDNKFRYRLLHDMKGPVTNAQGFTNECTEVLSILQSLIENNNDGLNEEQVRTAHELIVEDLQPCLNYLSQTIVTLTERIQYYEIK